MKVVAVDLPDVIWQEGRLGRFWYVQPRFEVDPRTLATTSLPGAPTSLELLDAVLARESELAAPVEAPAFILFPEVSVEADDVDAVRQRIAAARPNTIFVIGLTPLTDAQVQAIEPQMTPRFHLWSSPSEGRRTNCAVVGVGGSPDLFVQPKIVPSRDEMDWLWSGDTIRYFRAGYFRFAVLVCSELLDRPAHQTTTRGLVDEIARRFGALELVIWIQYNRASRSDAFLTSIQSLLRLGATIPIINTARLGARLNNFSVSGALVPSDALASSHSLLVKPYHYVEPVAGAAGMSRVVLLRYDADAYQVATALAHSIPAAGAVAKGALFQQSQPYIFADGKLDVSNTNQHLIEISRLGIEMARTELPAAREAIETAGTRLTDLTTRDFLNCLDIASPPRQINGQFLHAAGQSHPAGGRAADFDCRCWSHRECIDCLADDRAAAEPLAHYMIAIGAMASQGLDVVPGYHDTYRTNADVAIGGGGHRFFGVVYAGDYNAAAVMAALGGRGRPRLVAPPYVVLGPGELPVRRKLADLDAGLAAPRGGPSAGIGTTPVPRAMFDRTFWSAFDNGRLRDAILDLVTE